MIVVGVDAAIRRSGWAVVAGDVVLDTGAIAGPSKLDRAGRCWLLNTGLATVFNEARRLNRGKVCVVLEKPGAWARSKQRSTQIAVESLAMARASAMIAATWIDQPVVELVVDEARSLVLGSPRPPARGSDVKAWVRQMLRLAIGQEIADDDVADAIVVALAGYRLWKIGDDRFPVFVTA